MAGVVGSTWLVRRLTGARDTFKTMQTILIGGSIFDPMLSYLFAALLKIGVS